MSKNKIYLFLITAVFVCCSVFGQQKATITIQSNKPSGLINPNIYGQLFEHIYFSADGGLWGEMIAERSFEPEQYPGISPRDGFFDGWYTDGEEVLHSPTLYEQPIPLTTVETDKYVITADIKWRGYKLARHMWSGGYADMRVVFKNSSDSLHYRFRVHDPQYEPANPRNPQSVVKDATFAIEKELITERQGRDCKMKKMATWEVVSSAVAKPGQIDKAEAWHNFYIEINAKDVSVKWDGEEVLNFNGLEGSTIKNDIAFGVNYTEAHFKNIQVSSIDRFLIYMTGMPDVVINPPVAPQWKSFGNGAFEMVKGDAINMKYSQKITAGSTVTGVQQGPFYIKKGETYIGSVWAKGDGKTELTIALNANGKDLIVKKPGKLGTSWKKYEFKLDTKGFEGDASLNIGAKSGSLQVDQVTMMSQTAITLGGFRPDIYQAVQKLGPTNLRWPGGGYAAQYSWKWGVGPQENRQRWAHYMWMNYDQNNFGTDEFLQLCSQINSEPVMVVRIGFDRPKSEHAAILQEACDWVAYCNEPASGKWGSQRSAYGHSEPYNVKYWEIDNEMWEFGIENYEAAVREFSTAMHKVDPTIKIIICGGFGIDGDKAMIERSGSYFDYISLHHYENPNGYATGPEKLTEQYQKYADIISASPNPNIKLYISEWNLSSIDWRTGLFAGGFLNVCEKQPIVAMGAAALFIRRTDAPDWNNAFINFDYKGLFVAPNYLVTKLWHDNFSKNRLNYTGETGDLSISSTLSEDGKNVIVKLVNPTESVYELKIEGDWKSLFNGVYDFIAPDSINSANSMESPDAVKVEQKEIIPDNNIATINIAPLSAGVIKLKIDL
jgi:alpha-L-arabinofuranosidase